MSSCWQIFYTAINKLKLFLLISRVLLLSHEGDLCRIVKNPLTDRELLCSLSLLLSLLRCTVAAFGWIKSNTSCKDCLCDYCTGVLFQFIPGATHRNWAHIELTPGLREWSGRLIPGLDHRSLKTEVQSGLRSCITWPCRFDKNKQNIL